MRLEFIFHSRSCSQIPHLTAVQSLYMRLDLARPSSPSTEGKTVGPRPPLFCHMPKPLLTAALIAFIQILVWGGATAVGHHALQLAVLSGYKVLTTASPANHERLLALGATACFNYRDADVVKQIKSAAGKEGVFAAVDCASEKGSTEACIGEHPMRHDSAARLRSPIITI